MKKQRASQLVEAAIWLEATGDLEGARKLYQQALNIDPENARAQQALERDQARAAQAAPAPPAPPPEPRLTPVQYQAPHEVLPRVDPEVEEQVTLLDLSLHRLQATPLPEEPKRTLAQFPDVPEPKTPAVPPPRPLPEERPPVPARRSLDAEWSDLGTTDASTAPTLPGVPREVVRALLEDLPPPPPPEPLTPPPPRPPPQIPPNMTRRRTPAPVQPTPPPRNAWEEDGTAPGVELSAAVAPARPRDAMDLLSDAPPRATPPPVRKPENLRQEVESLIKGARDMLELDDHSGAMDLIEKAAELAPDDPMVQRLKQNSEVVLQSMYESKLGRLDSRPRLLLRPDEIIWLNLDHRAGFVLAQIDGSVTYEDLFAICGMSRLDTLRILAQLVGAGVIAATYG